MAVKTTGIYEGNLYTRMRHEPSKNTITTDAPVDNGGEGSCFSPTDLVVAALGSCLMTILALVAKRDSVDLSGMHVELEKHMSQSPPRRISQIHVMLFLPAHLSSQMRTKLERSARSCPVKQSLHPDIDIKMETLYQ